MKNQVWQVAVAVGLLVVVLVVVLVPRSSSTTPSTDDAGLTSVVTSDAGVPTLNVDAGRSDAGL